MHSRTRRKMVKKSFLIVIGNDVQANDYSSGDSDMDDNFALKSEE